LQIKGQDGFVYKWDENVSFRLYCDLAAGHRTTAGIYKVVEFIPPSAHIPERIFRFEVLVEERHPFRVDKQESVRRGHQDTFIFPKAVAHRASGLFPACFLIGRPDHRRYTVNGVSVDLRRVFLEP
jgi:hypothetical protein